MPPAPLLRRLWWAFLSALCLVTIAPAFGAGQPLPLQILLALLVGLACARPFDGLLLVVGLFPLAAALGGLTGLPWRGAQVGAALALAFLGGWFAHLAWRSTVELTARLLPPVLVTAAVLVASAAVNTWAAPGVSAGPPAFTTFTDYLPRQFPDHPWYAAMDALVGLAMLLASASILDGSGARARQLLRMVVIGVAAAATLNLLRFAHGALRTPDPVATARESLRWFRVNIHFADVNAAGSLFAMATPFAVALLRTSRAWMAWVAVVVLCLAAAWLAGSRVGLAALMLAVMGGFVWDAKLLHSRRRAIAAGVLIVVGLATAMTLLWRFPRAQANIDPGSAVQIRLEMFTRAARMVEDHPAFGVGVGRFFAQSARYASPDSFGPENAHNDVLQVVAERGILGLAAFLWLLAAAARPALRPHPGLRPLAAWTMTGLGAYLVSGIGGHPLIVFESAIPFWIVLGMVSQLGGDGRAPGRRAWRVAWVLAAVALASIPWRVHGLPVSDTASHPWESDGAMRFRNVGREDTILIQPPVDGLTIPLRLAGGAAGSGTVDVTIDDRLANRITVASDVWQMLHLVLPPRQDYANRRITLRLTSGDPGASLLVGRVSLR
jgi:O-antigen ligase